MNAFEEQLKQARKRRHRMFVGLALGIGGLISLATGWVLFSEGTHIKVLPEEAAAVSVVSVATGPGISISNSIYGFSKNYEVNVAASGFEPQKIRLDEENIGSTVVVELKERPARILAETRPSDKRTRWFVDGDLVSVSQSLEIEAYPGSHEIVANHPYFEPSEQKVDVGRAEQKRVSFELKPTFAEVSIASEPSGATLFINGESKGATPLRLNLEGGGHAVSLTYDGYQDLSSELEVVNTEPSISRTYKMQRQPAFLSVVVEPKGGLLVVAGGKTNPGEEIKVDSNTPIAIRYSKSGYQSVDREVRLEPHSKEQVSITLNPNLGKLSVQSNIPADVFIDGKPKGKTPYEVTLPAIGHKVSVRKAGYRTVEKAITTNAQRTALVSAKLIPELTARLGEAPRETKGPTGIEMILFEPTAFRMGGERHEVGQRANEFVRQIDYLRPFYAGKYEVTNAQFGAFNSSYQSRPANEPATSVSWFEAVEFCNWLSNQAGLTPFYNVSGGKVRIDPTSEGYRLLTEAEWEWLARRAGRKVTTVFPWGDDPVIPKMTGNVADESSKGMADFYVPNYSDGAAGVTSVGRYRKEPSGVFDLAGNVSEWVHDFYSVVPPKKDLKETDPLGPSFGESRVIKGANFRSGTRTELRAAYREGLNGRRDDVGFRVGRYLYGGPLHDQ